MTLKNRALYEQHCTWLYPVTFCEIASVSPMPHELWKSLKDRTSLKTECFVFTILAIGEGEFFPEGLTGFEVSLASICVRLRTSSIQPQVPFVSTSTALNYFSSFLLPISQVPVLNRPQRAWRTLHCNVRWSSNAKYSLYCRNYAAPSQHIGYFLLAVSIKPHNQPQGIWETWKTELVTVAYVAASQVSGWDRVLLLRTRGRDQSGDGTLRRALASVLLLWKEQEPWYPALLGWASRCSDNTRDVFQDSCRGKCEDMATSFCLLPTFFPCPLEKRLPFPELKASPCGLSLQLRPSGTFWWQRKDIRR